MGNNVTAPVRIADLAGMARGFVMISTDKVNPSYEGTMGCSKRIYEIYAEPDKDRVDMIRFA